MSSVFGVIKMIFKNLRTKILVNVALWFKKKYSPYAVKLLQESAM
jgi:hypothetical protein